MQKILTFIIYSFIIYASARLPYDDENVDSVNYYPRRFKPSPEVKFYHDDDGKIFRTVDFHRLIRQLELEQKNENIRKALNIPLPHLKKNDFLVKQWKPLPADQDMSKDIQENFDKRKYAIDNKQLNAEKIKNSRITTDVVKRISKESLQERHSTDFYFIAIVSGLSSIAIISVALLGFFIYRWKRKSKAAALSEYPAFGVNSHSRDKSLSGDSKLAQSAQIYHYQHQKQQMISMEGNRDSNSQSEVESDEESCHDYMVFECPGLAQADEMEVKNPVFIDDAVTSSPTPNVD